MDIDEENNQTRSSSRQTVGKKPVSGYQIPWIEKYRPQTLQDVVGNEETVLRLQAIAVDGNLPNLILSGPPGTGKVSRIFLQRIVLIQPNICACFYRRSGFLISPIVLF